MEIQRTLKEWLLFLEQLNPDRICLGLERVTEVLSRLGAPEDCLFLEVAGTNGKGSTAALIAGALVNSGIRTGLYTSPHLYSFTERISVDGRCVAEQELSAAFVRVEEARGEIPLTYFEYTTLAALVCFKNAGVKVCVLEVGLGGRLDAVNALDADLAVLTSIGLDHTALLGNTEERVAYEKAGIIKSKSLVVLGTVSDQAQTVIKARVRELKAALWCEGEDFSYRLTEQGGVYVQHKPEGNRFELKTGQPKVPAVCVGAALCALHLLQTRFWLPLSEEGILQAVSTVCLPGRMQQISTAPSIVLDVAHNVPAALHLKAQLEHRPVAGRRVALVGMLGDKDIEGVMHALCDCFVRFYLVTLPTARGAPASRLAAALRAQDGFKGSVRTCQEVSQALGEALSELSPGDELMIFGSFVTVALAGEYFGLNK